MSNYPDFSKFGCKAVRELGLPQSPLKQALKDAVDWFIAEGYVK